MSNGSLKIIRNFDDPYAHIENAILRDKRMSLAERGFFALVLSLPTNREMTLVYFSKVSGANKETVGKYFRKLEELGYLKRYRERGDHGVFGSTIYEFTTSKASPCTDFPYTAEPDTVEPGTAEPEPVNPSEKNKRRKNINPPIVPQGDSAERFEKFWTYYHDVVCAEDHSRAGSKGDAREAWGKLNPDKQLADRLALYLAAQMETEMWRRGIGIPYASTLLNKIRNGKLDLTPAQAQEAPHRPQDESQEEAFGQWH